MNKKVKKVNKRTPFNKHVATGKKPKILLFYVAGYVFSRGYVYCF